MTRRVLFAGGGTAGHVTPALATAAALLALPEVALAGDVEVEFVGTAAKIEARMVPEAGYRLHRVVVQPIARSLTPSTFTAPAAVLAAAYGVARIIRRRDVVAAAVFGGYVSGPLALAALLTRTPLVIHEQNAVPGLANRIAARWARHVAASVEGTQSRFPHEDRVTVTGNPVRADLLAAADDARRDEARRDQARAAFGLTPERRTLLVFGGSLGARRINAALVGAGPQLADLGDVQVLHATGAGDHTRTTADWDAAGAGLPVTCVPFVDRMDLAYAAADLVLCRAGASTLAELTALGLPSVLVPYPHSLADEQTANARALTRAGAAVLVPDAELDAARLMREVAPLLRDDEARWRMGAAARTLGRPDAAQAVARLITAAAELGKARS